MKKHRKKYLAFLLVWILTAGMAGCTKSGAALKTKDSLLESGAEQSGSRLDDPKAESKTNPMEAEVEDDASAKGRYIETEIETPQGFSGEGNIQRLADKSLLLFDVRNCTVSISDDDGKTWDTKTVSSFENIWTKEGITEISSVALAEYGGVFLSYTTNKTNDDGTMPGTYLYFSIKDPEKTMRRFTLDTLGAVEYLCESEFTADGRLFAISTTQNVYEIDLENESCRQIFTMDSGRGSGLCSSRDFLIATDGAKAYFYDLKSGETAAEDETLNVYITKQREKSYGIAMCAAKNGTDSQMLYVAGCNGIAGHVTGGSVMEQLVDGALSSLGDPSKHPEKIIRNEDGSFLVLFEDGELDSYVYDEEASAVPDKQLVIYGLYDNETVRQAISVFRKQNPDVFVRFETALSSGTGMTQNDAVKNLNTELLAGEGPDLILLDDMPLESYEEKGMLMDLSELAADLARSGNYFEGILNGFQSSKGTYALPFRYQALLLAGESSVLPEISDLRSLADAAEKLADMPDTPETVLGSYTPEETLEKLFLASANAWTTADGEVNTDAVKEFLTQAARIYQADQKNLDAEELEAHREYVDHIRRSHKEEKEAAKILYGVFRVFEQFSGKQRLTAGYLTSMNDLCQLTTMKKELKKQNISLEYGLLQGQSGEIFRPTGTVGISIHSREKELAEAFIRILLGSDVQERDFNDGFPVNAAALEAFAADPMPDKIMATGSEDREGNPAVFSLTWPDEQELEQIKTILDALKTPAVFESSLKKEVIKIGASALKGEKEIDEGAKEIAQKISLHLKE